MKHVTHNINHRPQNTDHETNGPWSVVRGRSRPSGGYTLITALVFFLAGSTAVIAGITDSVMREVRIVRNESASKQSYYASESALEDAIYRVKYGKTIGVNEFLDVGSSTASTTVTTEADGSQKIVASGDIDTTVRTMEASLAVDSGITFSYALQAGLGGIDMYGSSQVLGDIYTTGSIRGCGSCQITGRAVAAGRSTSAIDIDNSAPVTPANSIIFGNNNSTQDLGQSFQISSTLSIMKAQLYIKKVGNPANATVKIVNDNSGKPTGSILASGTLSSSLVTTSYTWQEITLSANPILTSGTTYWLLIDANTSSSNYYAVAANASYANGTAKTGRSSWDDTGYDAYVKIYIGNNEEGITGEDSFNTLQVQDAYAYETSYLDVDDELWCQIGVDNSESCDTTHADPEVEANPVPLSTITALENEAAVSVFAGDYDKSDSSTYTLGPKKITGDLHIGGSADFRISGTLWVQGNVIFDGTANIWPDLSTKSYAMVVDGTVSLGGSAQIHGGPDNHILIISKSTADPAITISGSADDTVVFTSDGGLLVDGSGKVNVAAAKHITLNGSAQIVYDSTVTSIQLTSGGGGGTFGIKTWKETE
jgi:hypothetical protein